MAEYCFERVDVEIVRPCCTKSWWFPRVLRYKEYADQDGQTEKKKKANQMAGIPRFLSISSNHVFGEYQTFLIFRVLIRGTGCYLDA